MPSRSGFMFWALDNSPVPSPSGTHAGLQHDHRAGLHLKFGAGIDGLPVLPGPGDLRGVEDRNSCRPELRSRKHKIDRLMAVNGTSPLA
jgi:hypothetical protein